ncbi:MAG TPA: YihA family ribosome biogenesis GTP-binding protein, partial [Pseudomonas sp.]|nr:YihA family ribosome biogenesis GTP-binding protein [Pseudomonas sp.]
APKRQGVEEAQLVLAQLLGMIGEEDDDAPDEPFQEG